MARLFIDVHPDGTFTTGPWYGDPVAHAANQSDGVVTYMTGDVGDVDKFGFRFQHYTREHGYGFGAAGRWVGDWQAWGAYCILQWGAWFERIDCRMRRNRTPTTSEKLRERVIRLISDGEKSLGLIKNRLKGFDSAAVESCLASLVVDGLALRSDRLCGTNGKTFSHYRAPQV